MNKINVEKIQLDVQHIFDSGVNEIRVVELIINLLSKSYEEGFNKGYDQAQSDHHKWVEQFEDF